MAVHNDVTAHGYSQENLDHIGFALTAAEAKAIDLLAKPWPEQALV